MKYILHNLAFHCFTIFFQSCYKFKSFLSTWLKCFISNNSAKIEECVGIWCVYLMYEGSSFSSLMSLQTHGHAEEIILTRHRCYSFQLEEQTSDTGTQRSPLIGCSFRNECVKGNWGQTVDPENKNGCEEWQEGGTGREKEGGGHGSSRHESVRRGGGEDPFRWSTKSTMRTFPHLQIINSKFS